MASSNLKLNLFLIPLLQVIILASHLPRTKQAKPDQVIEFFRHGARTPIFKYDPSWPKSDGVLTTIGMLQHYKLGKKIAEKYPHLVESGYNSNDVYVLSNFAPRCIDSALAHVSSMFRGKNSTLTKENLQQERQEGIIKRITPYLPKNETNRGEFVPIQVDVVSNWEQELVFDGRSRQWCKIMGKYRDENTHSREMNQGWRIFQNSVSRANTFLPPKQKITNMTVLSHAFDAFIVDLTENRTLPGNIKDKKLVESLGYGKAYSREMLDHLQHIQRKLTSFVSFHAIREQLQNFREGKNPKKLALFSGHDGNLMDYLSAFGLFSAECLLVNYKDFIQNKPLSFPHCKHPKFAANLIFEFYNDTTNPYIKVYNDDVLIRLCNGKKSCTYDEFLSLIRNASGNHTLETWNNACQNKPLQQNAKQEEGAKAPYQEDEAITNTVKTIESNNGTNQWLIVGSAILSFVALTILLKIFATHKWNPFRKMNKKDMVKYQDETEVEAEAEA